MNEGIPQEPANEATILDLAKQYLDTDGEIEVETYIEQGKLSQARFFILGVIDGMWKDKKITDDEAKQVYDKLGINLEDRADVRTHSKNFNK